MSGENIISVIPGTSAFWSIIFSNPLPIETAKKIWGIIPIKVAKKKLYLKLLEFLNFDQSLFQFHYQ